MAELEPLELPELEPLEPELLVLLPPELLVDPLPPPEPLDEELPKGPPMGVSFGELHPNPLATPTRKTTRSPKATFRMLFRTRAQCVTLPPERAQLSTMCGDRNFPPSWTGEDGEDSSE